MAHAGVIEITPADNYRSAMQNLVAGDTLILAQNLVRLSRGKMLGVDFNKQFTWVGSSVALSTDS
jgi:hypothetical protein